MKLVRSAPFLSALLFLCQPAFAAFDIEGFLHDNDGNAIPGAYKMSLEIQKSGEPGCILYREEFDKVSVDVTGSFVVSVGHGERSSGFDSVTIDDVLKNESILSCRDVNGTVISSYKPNSGDVRAFKVDFEIAPGTVISLGPSTLSAVPYSTYAKYLDQHSSKSLLRVEDGGTPKEVSPFSSSDVVELRKLLDGSSTQYLPRSASAGASLPSFSGSPTSPQAGSIWYDSNDHTVKFFNGVSTVTLGSGSGSGTVTSITAGAGLTGGTITESGTIALEDIGTPGTYYKVEVDSKGRVTSGATSLVEGDLPTIKTPGKVSGDAIISGTIGGSASINTTGSIASLSASTRVLDLYDSDNSNRIRFQAPSSLANDYTLTWPETPGSSGQVLTTDGAGHLTWTTPAGGSGSGSVGNETAGGDLSGSYPNPAVVKIQGNVVSPETLTSVDAGKVYVWNGTSFTPKFFGIADLKNSFGSSYFPQCEASQTLIWNSATDSLNCVDISIPSSAVAGLGAAAALGIGTGLTTSGGNIVVDFGTGAGKVVQGNDSRLPSSACSPGNKMRWDGNFWVCEPDNATDPTKVSKAGDVMTGMLTLPDNGLVVGNNQLAVKDDKIGIGEPQPVAALMVSKTAGEYGQFVLKDPNSFMTDSTLRVFMQGHDNMDNPVWRMGVWDSSKVVQFGSIFGGHKVALTTDNQQRLIIDLQGNVGIGTGNPVTKLDVAGSVKASGPVIFGQNVPDTDCKPEYEGAQRYNPLTKTMQFCNGTSWTSIGGNTLIGSLFFAARSNCTWTTNSSNWTSSYSGCSQSNWSSLVQVTGSVSTESQPLLVRVTRLYPGTYRVRFTLFAYPGADDNRCGFRITDGSNNGPAVYLHNEEHSSDNHFRSLNSLEAVFRYTNVMTDVEFAVQARALSGKCQIAADTSGTGFYEHNYSDIFVTVERIGD